eukprot:SAG11_NODE_1177_length_5600_cov_2.043447_4_plen_35_part_00
MLGEVGEEELYEIYRDLEERDGGLVRRIEFNRGF